MIKKIIITKGEHAFKGFASTYNVEISFKPELQLKEELHSNYIFLHFAFIGLEWNSITLFTKMNFFFFQKSHFITI